MSETPTTQLEAVNLMLRAIGESPVSSLSGDIGVDVVTAKATLATVQRQVQMKGWLFNTEYDFPLLRDVQTGEINIPTNTASVDLHQDLFSGGVDPVSRGTRVYDRANHTYVFQRDLCCSRIIFYLPFEEMPETARNYIAVRAARVFQDDSTGSRDMHVFKEQDELQALSDFLEDQSEDEDWNYLANDPMFGKIVRY